jgi:hypothetical protein
MAMLISPPTWAERFLLKLWRVGAGDGAKSRSQLIERKIELLEDMATRVRMLILIGVCLLYLLPPFFSSSVMCMLKVKKFLCISCDDK